MWSLLSLPATLNPLFSPGVAVPPRAAPGVAPASSSALPGWELLGDRLKSLPAPGLERALPQRLPLLGHLSNSRGVLSSHSFAAPRLILCGWGGFLGAEAVASVLEGTSIRGIIGASLIPNTLQALCSEQPLKIFYGSP